jgi:putative peptidoglycan lipid II flippase
MTLVMELNSPYQSWLGQSANIINQRSTVPSHQMPVAIFSRVRTFIEPKLNRLAGSPEDANSWGGGSVNRRILSAATTVARLVILVKTASLAKEMLIARKFGASDALDAFYIALLLPSFLGAVIDTSFNAAFIPIYIEAREREDSTTANRLFSNISVFNIAVLALVAAILAGLQRWLLPIIGSGFGPQKLALARPLFFLFLISMSLVGLSALWRAALNAHDRFTLASIAPISNPIAIVILLMAVGHRWGIYALAAGSVLGTVGELAIVGCGLYLLGVPLMPRWYGVDSWTRQVLWQYAPTVTGALLMGGTTLVDPAMAAMLGSGSVSALNYAYKLPALVLNIGLSSLSIAILPSFSRLSAKENWREMRRVLLTYTGLLALVTIPVTGLLIVFSRPLVSIFFQGGAFTAADTTLVVHAQMMFCLEIPFYSVAILYVRAISSLKRNNLIMWGTSISVSANVALNILFMRLIGLPGIALSTSAVYALNCGYLSLMLFRALRQHERATSAAPIPLQMMPSEGSAD